MERYADASPVSRVVGPSATDSDSSNCTGPGSWHRWTGSPWALGKPEVGESLSIAIRAGLVSPNSNWPGHRTGALCDGEKYDIT